VGVSNRKLGKGPKREDSRNLKLATYLDTTALPPVPKSTSHRRAVAEWPMYGNDRYGDCVFAGAGHETQLWTALGGKPATPDEQAVLDAYSAVTGFDPRDPATDQGTVVLDALNWRRKVGLEGHKLGAYVEIDPHRHSQFRRAIDLFVCVGLGVSLPIAAQDHDDWHYPIGNGPDDEPGSWGGHYTPAIDFDAHGLFVVTWGEVIRVSWAFIDRYCDEAYALLSAEMLHRGRDAHGFSISQLQSDLGLVRG
jgi:hypothetical protein